MEGFTEDELAEMGAEGLEDLEAAAQAKAARIAKARAGAASYQARMEEPKWYLNPPPTPYRQDRLRLDMLIMNRLWVEKKWDELRVLAMPYLATPSGKEKGKARLGPAEETELLDLVMRSALKTGQIDSEVVELARRCPALKRPALLEPAASLLAAAPPSLVPPLEAIEALLASFASGRSPPKTKLLLSEKLASLSPLLSSLLAGMPYLAEHDETETLPEVDKLALSDAGRRALLRAVKPGSELPVEEDETVRDVRTL